MLQSITDFTNIKIGLLHLFQHHRHTKEGDVVEVRTLFGLPKMVCMMRASHMNIDDFYNSFRSFTNVLQVFPE